MMKKHAVIALAVAWILLLAGYYLVVVPQDTPALKTGVKLTYEISVSEGGRLLSSVKTFEVTKVLREAHYIYANWTSGDESGVWNAIEFGSPIVVVGEKWISLNYAFYEKVSDMLGRATSAMYTLGIYTNYRLSYDLRMAFEYWRVFKGFPRLAKIYFYNVTLMWRGRLVLMYAQTTVYFSNGVLAYTKFLNMTDLDLSGTFEPDEIYEEEWRLLDWNLPPFAAKSPVIDWLVCVSVVALIVVDLYLVHRWFCKPLIEKYSKAGES